MIRMKKVALCSAVALMSHVPAAHAIRRLGGEFVTLP
jgi:hypothetical protein